LNSIRVMIVEDDFMVADLNRQFTESCEGFSVVKIAHTGAEALEFISLNPVDLVVLDIFLPDIQGTEVLKDIRRSDYPADILLITAAHNVNIVEETIRLGVFDYIIKPFDVARYRESLSNYRRYRESLESGQDIDQRQVDVVVAGARRKNLPLGALPKGINSATMDMVRKALLPLQGEIGIDDICAAVPLSHITAYRYLEHLVQEGFLEKSCRYQHVGRPMTVYTRKRN